MKNRLACIIPGFDELPQQTSYRNVKLLFQQQNIRALVTDVGWKQRTLSSYLKHFLAAHKSRPYCLLGFSLGAMIAVSAAAVLQPRHLILCSLSPFFQEDISSLTQDDQHTLGKRRIADLNNFSLRALARRINCTTHILAGSAESKVLIRRCEIAQHEIQDATFTKIPGAVHSLSDWRYQQALGRVIKKIAR